jgi:hypothetical protein
MHSVSCFCNFIFSLWDLVYVKTTFENSVATRKVVSLSFSRGFLYVHLWVSYDSENKHRLFLQRGKVPGKKK